MLKGSISQKSPLLRGILYGQARQILRATPPEGAKQSFAIMGLQGPPGPAGTGFDIGILPPAP